MTYGNSNLRCVPMITYISPSLCYIRPVATVYWSCGKQRIRADIVSRSVL